MRTANLPFSHVTTLVSRARSSSICLSFALLPYTSRRQPLREQMVPPGPRPVPGLKGRRQPSRLQRGHAASATSASPPSIVAAESPSAEREEAKM